MASLLTFFLAFYTASCYTRFLDQYTHLKEIEGHIRTIAMQVRLFYLLPSTGEDGNIPSVVRFRTLELFRYLGSTYYLLYSHLYSGDSQFDLNSAHDINLLTEQECDRLESSSPSLRWFRTLSWSAQLAQEMCETGGMEKSDNDQIIGEILSIRGAMNRVSFQAQLPVPFPYYHIITILCFAFVLVYSYAVVFVKSSIWFVTLIYLVPLFGFSGMREVAIAMSDPFGDDDVDLPVGDYVRNMMKFLVQFCEETNRPTVADGGVTFKNDVHWAETHAQDTHTIRATVKEGLKAEKTDAT